ncbi:MAG: prohead protease/major capsid protein fusion protein, partial [Stellaceae bacterium]
MPDLFVRRAALSPQTANAEARTVEVVWSSGAPVRRRDMAGSYVERLNLDPAAVDLSRLIGASVLDAHRQTAVRDVLGTVRDARVDGNQGMASLQFSARPEVEPIWQDVLAGILRHVSVGYTVERWQDTTDPATGERIRTAVAWTPIEISLVPTPADPGATIRTGGIMPEIAIVPAETPANPPPTEIETRAAINAEIRSIAHIAGLGAEFVDPLIDRAASADEARRAAFDALAQRGGGTIRTEQTLVEVIESQDDPAIRVRQMGEALYARINPQHQLS